MADAKGNTFENDILKLIFNATPIADLADDDQTSPVTDLTVALHTASPGETGDQTTNEISYTGYARVSVPRDNTGWTVTANEVNPVDPIEFGLMTAGAGGTVTHFSVGTGVGDKMLYYGTVSPNLSVVNGVVPRLSTSTVIREL